MSRFILNKRIMLAAGALSLAAAAPAFASVKHVYINADHDSIGSFAPGQAFLPEFEVDEDEDLTLVLAHEKELPAGTSPTTPVAVEVRIYSDGGQLDEDLDIRGTGIRSTYVDDVDLDGTEARARLQVYPFYQLMSPVPVVDYTAKRVSWAPVPYAGNYEIGRAHV